MIFYIVTMVGFWMSSVHQIAGGGEEAAFAILQRQLLPPSEDNLALLHLPETGVNPPHLQKVEFVSTDKTKSAQIWAWGKHKGSPRVFFCPIVGEP